MAGCPDNRQGKSIVYRINGNSNKKTFVQSRDEGSVRGTTLIFAAKNHGKRLNHLITPVGTFSPTVFTSSAKPLLRELRTLLLYRPLSAGGGHSLEYSRQSTYFLIHCVYSLINLYNLI
jgi:hypothetical protein